MAENNIDDDGTEIRNCKFAFKCPKFWSELTETHSLGVRFCDSCQQDVYRCVTDEDIASAIRHNRCVAILQDSGEPESEETYTVGMIEPG